MGDERRPRPTPAPASRRFAPARTPSSLGGLRCELRPRWPLQCPWPRRAPDRPVTARRTRSSSLLKTPCAASRVSFAGPPPAGAPASRRGVLDSAGRAPRRWPPRRRPRPLPSKSPSRSAVHPTPGGHSDAFARVRGPRTGSKSSAARASPTRAPGSRAGPRGPGSASAGRFPPPNPRLTTHRLRAGGPFPWPQRSVEPSPPYPHVLTLCPSPGFRGTSR